MFSFNKGRAVAYVQGLEDNGKILRLCEDAKDGPELKGSPVLRLSEDWFRDNFKGITAPQLNVVLKALQDGRPPISHSLAKIYNISKEYLDRSLMREYIIETPGSSLIPVLNSETPDRIYIAGPSGSGKSVMSSKYMQMYNILYPTKKIYIFSRIEEDPAFADVKNVERIMIDDSLLVEPMTAEELKDSLVLVDDIDTITDEKIAKVVRKLRDDILECGRHFNIYIICTSHKICDFNKTKTMLNEATAVVFFPQSGGAHQIKRLMREYVGASAKETEHIMRLPSRWVAIYKHYPQYVMYDRGIFLMHSMR